MKRLAVLLALAALLGGCTHRYTVSSAFDDLVNETRSTSTSIAEYRSIVSISGLVPHSAPGTIFYNAAELSPTHGISPSPKWSYVTESTYPMTDDPENDRKVVEAIRTLYLGAREAIVKAVAAQIQVALAAPAVDKASDPVFCALASDVLSTKVSGTNCTDDDKKNLAAGLVARRKVAADATAAAATAKGALLKAVNVKNVIVTRWDQKVELTFFGKLAEFFSIDWNRKEETHGVLIAGALRTTATKIGEDYIDMLREMDPEARKLYVRAGIDLFQIQARHVAYVNELKLEDAIAASLSVTVEQLKNLKSLLSADAELELKTGAAMLTEISNVGTLSAPTFDARTRCFFPPVTNQRHGIAEMKAGSGYQAVYTVRGQVRVVEELARVATDFSIKEEMRPKDPDKNKDRATREELIRKYDACEKFTLSVNAGRP